MGLDIRVPMSEMVAAFGVDITVTRPAPDNEPIETAGIWCSSLINDDAPSGFGLHRKEQTKILAIPIDDDLPTVPLNSIVDAPLRKGLTARRWRVDGFQTPEGDEVRVILVPIDGA